MTLDALYRTENPRVGGSIPPLATTSIKSIAYRLRDPSNRVPTIGLVIRVWNSGELLPAAAVNDSRRSRSVGCIMQSRMGVTRRWTRFGLPYMSHRGGAKA